MPTELTKLTVNLPAETVKAMRELAQQRGITTTEAIRQALENERFLRQEVQKGNHVLIEQPNGPARQLILP